MIWECSLHCLDDLLYRIVWRLNYMCIRKQTWKDKVEDELDACFIWKYFSHVSPILRSIIFLVPVSITRKLCILVKRILWNTDKEGIRKSRWAVYSEEGNVVVEDGRYSPGLCDRRPSIYTTSPFILEGNTVRETVLANFYEISLLRDVFLLIYEYIGIPMFCRYLRLTVWREQSRSIWKRNCVLRLTLVEWGVRGRSERWRELWSHCGLYG